jgi:hypothetical protein
MKKTKTMKTIITLLVIPALFMSGCAAAKTFLGSPGGQALLSNAETVAQVALEAAATNFGGPTAGKLASAGLDALASVLQGYIGKLVPPAIVKASPGIQPVGTAIAPLISSTAPVTQADVNNVYQAAAIAAQK